MKLLVEFMLRLLIAILLVFCVSSNASTKDWGLYPSLGEGWSVYPPLELQPTMNDLLELGNQLRMVRKHDDAKSVFEKLIELGKENNEQEFVAKGYVNLAWISEIQGRPEDAIRYHKMAFKLSKKIGYKEGIATGYRNLGIAHKKNGERETARLYYLRALEIYNELNESLDVKILTRMLSELEAR